MNTKIIQNNYLNPGKCVCRVSPPYPVPLRVYLELLSSCSFSLNFTHENTCLLHACHRRRKPFVCICCRWVSEKQKDGAREMARRVKRLLHSTKTRVLISSTQRKAGHSSSGLPSSPHWEAETGKRLELSAQPTRLIEMLYLKKN